MSGSGAAILHHISGHHTGSVNGVAFVENIGNQGGGIISVADDKQFIIFLMRTSGDYWPSVAEELPAPGTALFYDDKNCVAYIGLQTGELMIYNIINDYNAFDPVKTIQAHTDRITSIHVDTELKLIITCGRDKRVRVHSLATHTLLSSYNDLGAWGTVLQYDNKAPNVFVADLGGKVHVLKIDKKNKMKLNSVAVLEGHDGSVRSLLWHSESGLLFSGSFDSTVKVWDIGGCKGESYALRAHTGKVKGLAFVGKTKQLITAGSDKRLVVWELGGHKWKEDPVWEKSDTCQECGEPFLWNLSKMWEEKKLSVRRQHHCRWSGKAVCESCSPYRIIIPEMGHELKVRVSAESKPKITDCTPRAKTFPLNSEILSMSTIRHNGEVALLTCGAGGSIAIWKIQSGVLDAMGKPSTEFVSSDVSVDDLQSSRTTAASPVQVSDSAPTVYSTGADMGGTAGGAKSLLDELDDDDED